MISSVASGLMYEFQFQIPGTKKCHNPKQIVIILPAVARILLSIYIIYPPGKCYLSKILIIISTRIYIKYGTNIL